MKNKLQMLVMTIISVYLLTSGLIANAASLPVKDAWVINNNENVLALAQNGDLYFGEDIYSQNKYLILSDVADIYVSGMECVFVLLNSGEILKVDVQYISNQAQFQNNVNTIKNVYATKFFKTYAGEDSLFFVNDNNELMLLDKYEKVFKICNNAEKAYADGEKITVLTSDNKVIIYNNETITTILDNVKDINYSSVTPRYTVIVSALMDNNDLVQYKHSTNYIL